MSKDMGVEIRFDEGFTEVTYKEDVDNDGGNSDKFTYNITTEQEMIVNGIETHSLKVEVYGILENIYFLKHMASLYKMRKAREA